MEPMIVGFLAGGAAMAIAVGLLSSVRGSKRSDAPAEASDCNDTSPGKLGRSESSENIRDTFYLGDRVPPQILKMRTGSEDGLEPMVKRTSVTVKVPATSANMGPGFDTIGMALDMWSEITVSLADKFSMVNEGEGADDIPCDESNLVCVGLRKAYEMAGQPVPPLKYHIVNRIPYARGLGSSSAAIVGGILAGLVLAGHQLKAWGAEELLQIASTIEGHPDNVAPAIYGGIQIGMFADGRWWTERINLPAGLQVVIFIPDFVGKTSDARLALPGSYSIKDVVFNIGRIAWLVNALATNNLHNLRFGTQDRLHQPQRGAKVYKHLDPMIAAAEEAGASCCYLSGAGPSVLAITSGAAGDIFAQREKERVDRKVADAMLAAAVRAGVNGQVYISEPVLTGGYVAKCEPAFSSGLVRFKGDV